MGVVAIVAPRYHHDCRNKFPIRVERPCPMLDEASLGSQRSDIGRIAGQYFVVLYEFTNDPAFVGLLNRIKSRSFNLPAPYFAWQKNLSRHPIVGRDHVNVRRHTKLGLRENRLFDVYLGHGALASLSRNYYRIPRQVKGRNQ